MALYQSQHLDAPPSPHPATRRQFPRIPALTRLRTQSTVAVSGRAWTQAYRWITATADALLVTVTVVMVLTTATSSSAAMIETAGQAGTVGLAFAMLVGVMHGYDPHLAHAGRHEYEAIVRAGWVWAFGVTAYAYAAGLDVEPVAVLEGSAAAVAAVLLARFLQRGLVRARRRRGRWQLRTLLVGDLEHLEYLHGEIATRHRHGMSVVGACVPHGTTGNAGMPVLGDLRRAAQAISEHEIAVVIVSASCMSGAQLRRFCWEAERSGVEVLVAPQFEDVAPGRVRLRAISGTPLLAVALGQNRMTRMAKALMDRIVGSLLLIVALPVIGAGALLVRASSPGPVFYRQRRVGRGAVPFAMVKLRTMYIDADRRRAALMERSDGNEVLFKMRRDPRVTPIGRILRRFSVDELPQLWNVVRGEMSLVGPRPPLEDEVAGYDDDARHRLRAKPGLTGLWQVSGRSDLDWAQSIRLDLNYVDNRSVLMDLTILLRTFRAVLGGRGAY